MAVSKKNWDRGFMTDLNKVSGKSDTIPVEKRYLSQMREQFLDQDAVADILKNEDPVIYESYGIRPPRREGDLAFGTTIVHPGVIGEEYHMTRGHFRGRRGYAFICYTLSGEGYLVMENRKKESIVLPLRANEVSYVPRDFAHRLVNTGKNDLVVYYTSGSSIEDVHTKMSSNGFCSMVIRRNGYPAIIENPRQSNQKEKI